LSYRKPVFEIDHISRPILDMFGSAPSFMKTGKILVKITLLNRNNGGDALSAGLIHYTGLGKTLSETIEFASAANALKHSVHGDVLIAASDEVKHLADSSDGTVRMIR